MGKYVLCSLDDLKDQPEFTSAFEKLKAVAVRKASQLWPGMTLGGMFPKDNQFGITTCLPKFFTGFAATTLTTFRQNFTSTAWQNIFNMTLAEDIIIGMMGFAITGSAVNVTELRSEIGDVKYPRINIEEIQAYDKPAVIFRQGIICPEEKSFLVKGYIEATGYQRIVPVNGFVLYKKKDDVISE